MCLTLPWRVTAIVDADRALVCSTGRTLEVNRAFEPGLDVGDYVLVSCGFVVRRLTTEDAAEIAAAVASATDEAQARAAYDVSRRLVVEAARHGFGEYRAHLDFMDLAMEQYSFNDHVLRRFDETIKDAVDPNGILSPGKQGIWPRSMRAGIRAAG